MPCQVFHQPNICLRENNLLQFNEKKNANTFKNFYSNLTAELVNRLPTAKNIFGINSVKEYYSALNIPFDSFKLQLTNKEVVFKILNNVDPETACGLGEIPCRMLKDGAEILAEPISQNVNISLGSKFPKGCKTAKVRPIFKKGKNAELKSYRPVSFLPVMCKVFERAVHNQLIERLEKYKIIFDYQSGFRSKNSVNTCLAYLSNQISKKFEAIKSTVMLLIDLQKAFNTLYHQILLKKLKYLGFSPKTVRWFESYLKNRNLIVRLEKSLSEPGVLTCGVPQGSILGPILSLLYINDMKSAVTDCNLRLYADDTCVLSSDEKVSSIKKNLNTDYNSLCGCFIDNKLSIHLGEDKTKYILIKKGKKQCPALNITRINNKIKQYSVFEYLGCLLDEKLSGESMAKRLLKKIMEKRNLFIDRICTYLTLLNQCYITL